MRARVFPTLLVLDDGLVKTVQFKHPRYIGDPINAVRIFNEKKVDELVFLDIMATRRNHPPPIRFVSQISDECFMPLTVGGGIRNLDDIRALLQGGAEKVAINTAAFANPALVEQASDTFGSQSIVVALDVKRRKNGSYEVFTQGGTRPTGIDPVSAAVALASRGAGELLVTSIDRDGSMAGYDIELVRSVSDAVRIPVIACGGAGKPEDLAAAVDNGHASAVTAGSLFVFHGPRRAVLINFPTREELESLFDG